MGELVRALSAYKERLDEIASIRAAQSASRRDRDALILEKMQSLSEKLEGDAKLLILEDIGKIKAIADSVPIQLKPKSFRSAASISSFIYNLHPFNRLP